MALEDDFNLPVAKRQKTERSETETETETRSGSRLFAPFRTIGLVSPTRVPFTSIPLGKTTFQITTSIGQNLQTYDLRRGLNLVFLTRPQCPASITAIHAYRDRVFAAWGGTRSHGQLGIWVFKRGVCIASLECGHLVAQEIEQILVFGNWVIGCGPRTVEVWKNETYEHYVTISPSMSKQQERMFSGQICTLPTFLNKIFVGKKDGAVEVYNVSTGKLVRTILPLASSCGTVTALSPTPALSLLAIAYADGSMAVVDVEQDDALLRLQTGTEKPVTCISFRTDGVGAGSDGREDGVMATSSNQSGDITFWDLSQGGRVVGILRGAHEISSSSQSTGISKIEFLPGQPVVVSTGLDNALRTWVLDQTPFSPVPRILHQRSGHAAPISALKFLPAATDGSEAAGKWLLSAGQDRSLWGFSLRKDGQSAELSQGHVKHKAKKQGRTLEDSSSIEDLKAPPVTAIACSLNRDGGMGAIGGRPWSNPRPNNAEEVNVRGWESVVTAHENDAYARAWSWGRKHAGRWAFKTGDGSSVTSVAITACGTFALVGSTGGSLEMFNLQSGNRQQRFPPLLKPGQAKQLKADQRPASARGHTDAITGIIVDTLNRTVVSGGFDGQIIIWDFSSGQVLDRIHFEYGSPAALRYNPVSGLVSVACDDLCIRLVDIETRKLVRELWGCIGQIYDHCFSHDGRWIVTCSMDSVVRVFDLATGHLVDAFKTATCTHVAFSSTGEFLATAHAGQIGINIWNNKSLYSHHSSRQIDDESGVIDLTTSTSFNAASQLSGQEEIIDDEDARLSVEDTSSLDQLDSSLLTLSLVPPTRWQTLLNLEAHRQLNKPIQPPEKPKAAPFFLGSTTLNGTAATGSSIAEPEKKNEVSEVEQSRISRLASLQPTSSALSAHLQQYTTDAREGPNEIIAYLASLNPSAADLDIRSLTMNEMPAFVTALTARLRQRKDFELVNTWMSVFLRMHGEFVSGIDEVAREVETFKRVMAEEESRLSASVGWAKGVVEYLRSAR